MTADRYSEVLRARVIGAVKEWNKRGKKDFLTAYGYGDSKKFDLLFRGKRYAPKAVLGLALHQGSGPHRRPFWLHGGKYANRRLELLGFDIVAKDNVGALESKDLSGLPSRDGDILVTRGIKYRRGQRRFRDALFQAYANKCAITGCSVSSLLEAAHVKPHSKLGEYSLDNGLLLRADLHTLFDVNLLKIDPESRRIKIDTSIKELEYRRLHGKRLRQPKRLDHRVRKDYLTARWEEE